MPAVKENATESALKRKLKSRRALLIALLVGLASTLIVAVAQPSRGPEPCFVVVPKQGIVGTTYNEIDKRLRNCFVLELADTVAARRQGLSGRDRMAPLAGMLFVFDYPGRQCMWMKDMRFALDMIWLSENKKIIKIKENVKPETFPASFCSEKPAKYVIELNAGASAKAGLLAGQIIELKFSE